MKYVSARAIPGPKLAKKYAGVPSVNKSRYAEAVRDG